MKEKTNKLINSFLNLDFENKQIPCPYFNNKKIGSKAALRVLIGKGTPQEIIDETKIFALKQKINLVELDTLTLKKFLIENNLGIDCSGFVYHLLTTEYGKINFFYPQAKNFFRKLLIKLRPAENTDVSVFNHPKNSKEILLKNLEATNFIVSLEGGTNHNHNHIIFIESIEKDKNIPKTINYIHSFRWPSDGQYNHGVRRGKIEIIDENKGILEQKWIENEKTGDENWTYSYLKTAGQIYLKKLV